LYPISSRPCRAYTQRVEAVRLRRPLTRNDVGRPGTCPR
jgi:hypothetical protein